MFYREIISRLTRITDAIEQAEKREYDKGRRAGLEEAAKLFEGGSVYTMLPSLHHAARMIRQHIEKSPLGTELTKKETV